MVQVLFAIHLAEYRNDGCIRRNDLCGYSDAAKGSFQVLARAASRPGQSAPDISSILDFVTVCFLELRSFSKSLI